MDPPEGQVRTEVNAPYSGGAVIPAGTVTTVIAFVGVCLRLFTRKYVVKGDLGVDDCLFYLGLWLALDLG